LIKKVTAWFVQLTEEWQFAAKADEATEVLSNPDAAHQPVHLPC